MADLVLKPGKPLTVSSEDYARLFQYNQGISREEALKKAAQVKEKFGDLAVFYKQGFDVKTGKDHIRVRAAPEKESKGAKITNFIKAVLRRRKAKAALKEKLEARKAIKDKTANDEQIAWYVDGWGEIRDIIEKRVEDMMNDNKDLVEILKAIYWASDYQNDFGFGTGTEFAGEYPYQLIALLKKRDRGTHKIPYYNKVITALKKLPEAEHEWMSNVYLAVKRVSMPTQEAAKKAEEKKTAKKEKYEQRKEKYSGAGIPQGKANAKIFTKTEFLQALKELGRTEETLSKIESKIPDNKKVKAYLARTMLHYEKVD